MSRRVVVVTDGLAALDGGTMRGIEEVVADAAEQGTEIHVIDLGQHEILDEQLAGFAKAGGGVVRRARSSAQVRTGLLEVLAGRSQLLAQATRLEVEFNPKSVASYRVIGHEAQAGAGLLGGEVAADLHAGQAATALYEVILRPDGPDDVAQAKLSWRDPSTGEERQLTQRISRLQFATSFTGSPISLQLATLASEAAQIFRQSYFTTAASHSLDQVLETALSANPQVRQQPSFRQLISLIETARKARQRSSSTPTRGQLDESTGT
jgi:Ca-activated chloride channel family protein